MKKIKKPVNHPRKRKVKICDLCPNMKIKACPDPSDWFCDDDVMAVCTKELNENRSRYSRYPEQQSVFRVIECAMRPYQAKNFATPNWCPLKKKKLGLYQACLLNK